MIDHATLSVRNLAQRLNKLLYRLNVEMAVTSTLVMYKPLPFKMAGLIVPNPTHKGTYLVRVMKGINFSSEGRFDFALEEITKNRGRIFDFDRKVIDILLSYVQE